MRVRVSKEQFDEWKESPVTIAFFNLLLREANTRRYLLASGNIDKEKGFSRMGEEVYKLLTVAETYEYLVHTLEYEDILEDDNDSPSRTQNSSQT